MVRLGVVAGALGAALTLTGCGGGDKSAAAPLPLTLVADIPLTGGSARFDYQSIDPTGHLLAIAHLGASQAILVDLQTRRVTATIGRLADVRGVLAVPQLGRVYATATGTHDLVTIRSKSRSVVGRVRVGSFPDGIAYDPRSRRVFVSDGDAVTVVDARTNRVVGRISLPGGVGNVQLDPTTGHILVNHQGGGTLVEIDPTALTIGRRVALRGCDGNHGLLVDRARRRAYITCEANATLAIVDLGTGTQIGHLPTGDGPDVLAADPGLHRLYVASESGVLSVYATGAGAVREIAHAKLADNAHSVAVDPATHLVYLPLTDGGYGVPVLRVMKPC